MPSPTIVSAFSELLLVDAFSANGFHPVDTVTALDELETWPFDCEPFQTLTGYDRHLLFPPKTGTTHCAGLSEQQRLLLVDHFRHLAAAPHVTARLAIPIPGAVHDLLETMSARLHGAPFDRILFPYLKDNGFSLASISRRADKDNKVSLLTIRLSAS
jgi:hypothetical protein